MNLILCLIFFLSFQGSYSQPASDFDEIVSEIYNQDFRKVSAKIEKLKKLSPQVANYLQIDYLWWKLISANSVTNESEFLAALDELNNNDKNITYQDYNRLINFTYKIRYENLKNKTFSKYMTLLKFHSFMENIDKNNLKNKDSFITSMFELMDVLNVFMKYKFLTDHGFDTKNNIEKCYSSLRKIESMSNAEYKSFEVVKTYLLAKIYLEIELDFKKALDKFSKLSNMFPGNTIFKQTVDDYRRN